MYLKVFILLAFCTSTSWGFMIKGDPSRERSMEISSAFQTTYDAKVKNNDIKGLAKMFTSDFNFEDCKGHWYNRQGYTEIAVEIRSRTVKASVTEARADKDNIIFKRVYGDRKDEEMMLKKTGNSWKLIKGQELLC